MQCPRSVEGSRQQGEIRLGEFLSPPEQAHDDKEISIGKKRTPEFRHRDRIRHGGDNNYGKDADRKIGGPRYLLPPVSRETEWSRRQSSRATQRAGSDKLQLLEFEIVLTARVVADTLDIC